MNSTMQSPDLRSLLRRSKLVLQAPRQCWDTIAAEQTEPRELVTKLIAPWVVAGLIAKVIGLQMFGIYVPLFGEWRPSFIASLIHQTVSAIMILVELYGDAWVLSKLAPQFQASISFDRAFSLVSHAAIPALVVGLLGFIPSLHMGIGPLFICYSLLILFRGTQRMVLIPQERAAGFFIVALVALLIVHMLAASVVYPLAPNPLSNLLPD